MKNSDQELCEMLRDLATLHQGEGKMLSPDVMRDAANRVEELTTVSEKGRLANLESRVLHLEDKLDALRDVLGG